MDYLEGFWIGFVEFGLDFIWESLSWICITTIYLSFIRTSCTIFMLITSAPKVVVDPVAASKLFHHKIFDTFMCSLRTNIG